MPVILCGGSGTRLWPLSRSGFPKQFLALTGNETLFQQSLLRALEVGSDQIQVESPLIVTNEEHRFLALDQVHELQDQLKKTAARFLLEPAGKNTAPALTLAALAASEIDNDPILLVCPADQTIQDLEGFTAAIRKAVLKANTGAIVVMGITPIKAETGYGYIKACGSADALGTLTVSEFTEKPDIDTAKKYLASGDFYWNGGIFILKASIWLASIEKFRPDIFSACKQAWQGRHLDTTGSGALFIRPNREAFLEIPSESIDYAVIEKCPNSNQSIAMVPLDVGWSDLGVWEAVWQVGNRDTRGNVTHGDTLLSETNNSLVHANSRLVSVVGLDDVVVVETADAVLVTKRDKSQDVKGVVAKLDQEGREEKNLHRKVHRPWGWYDSIDESERFKVKRIMVNPGASLSLQMHHHRAEHWIVVKGVAEVTNGEKVVRLHENESTFIHQGNKHRLTNPGIEPLEIIEVQSGDYLGEDDIVRFEDLYKRT